MIRLMSDQIPYSQAIETLLEDQGYKAARIEWMKRDQPQYLFLVKGVQLEGVVVIANVSITDQIWIRSSRGKMGPYSANNCDMVARDWVVFQMEEV